MIVCRTVSCYVNQLQLTLVNRNSGDCQICSHYRSYLRVFGQAGDSECVLINESLLWL